MFYVVAGFLLVVFISYYTLKVRMPHLFWSAESRTLFLQLKKLNWTRASAYYGATSTDGRFEVCLKGNDYYRDAYLCVVMDDKEIARYNSKCTKNPVTFIVDELDKKINQEKEVSKKENARLQKEENKRLLKEVALTVQESLQGIGVPKKEEIPKSPTETFKSPVVEEFPRNVVKLRSV